MPRRRPDVRLHLIFLLLAVVPVLTVGAQEAGIQEAPVVLSLSQCIDAAFTAGTDNEVLQKNLAVSREQYSVAVSQSAYSLSAALGENATYGYGDETLLAINSLSSGFSQTPQAGQPIHRPRLYGHCGRALLQLGCHGPLCWPIFVDYCFRCAFSAAGSI